MPEQDGYDPGTPSWVDLTTPDLEGALRFYGGVFGWEFEDAGEEAGHYHQALVRGRRVAGLGPAQPGSPPMAYWTTYLSGTDVDAHAAAIAEAGGTVMFGPLEVTGQGRMLIAVDAEGAMFGIWEPQGHKGAQLVNENAALTWNQLMSRNLDGAARFLGSVFPYAFEALPETPFDAYRVFTISGRVVGGMLAMSEEVPAEAPPHWLTYFWLDDVDAGARRTQELGGELMREPQDSPYGRSATLRDPQGAVFAVIRGVN